VAHLLNDSGGVRGDSVDAGDERRQWLQIPAAHGRCRRRAAVAVHAVGPLLQRERNAAGPMDGKRPPWPRSGRIVEGDEVTEAQLQRLIGSGCDPVDGSPLGRAYPAYQKPEDPASTGISQEICARRRAVAGYDFTFSIPKSASILWGLADAATQSRIVHAHHAAVAEVVAFMERKIAATRTGTPAHDGGSSGRCRRHAGQVGRVRDTAQCGSRGHHLLT
jgi:hypothetical protein